MLGINQQELADTAEVSKRTVASFELGGTVLPAIKAALKSALTERGVIFIAENGEGPGVRLKKDLPTE